MTERKCALVGEQCVYPNCACYPCDDESLHAKQPEPSPMHHFADPRPPVLPQPVRYVVGFAMNPSDVLLLTKAKPEWQAGKLNGVGGKVEPNDPNLRSAMSREFFEETGVQVHTFHWTLFHTERFSRIDKNDPQETEVYFFYARVTSYVMREACENTVNNDEPCSVHPWRALPQHCIGNLDYLLLMAAHYWQNMMDANEHKNPSPWVPREIKV